MDEEALSEFYSQLKRMLDLVENPYADAISAEEMLENNDMIPHYYGGISNELMEQYAGICRLAYGTVYGLDAYGKICTGQKEKGFVVKPWNGQVENCFVPSLMLGISSKCKEEDAAKKFLSYFFSKEVQMLSSYAGFPVNLAALEDESFWDSQEETTAGSTMEFNGKTYDVMMTSSKIEKENIDWMIEHLSKAQTPVPYNYLITDEVRRQAVPYMNGEISLEEAVSAVSQKMNLYLTE